jgi:ribosomal protein S18 acetylase RimI-like enzyme
MNDLNLREAILYDRIQLDELFREELEYHVSLLPNIFKLPEIVIDDPWLKSILANKNTFLVVSDYNGTIVGAILYKIDTNPDEAIFNERKFGYIEELIVKELFRGKGVGKELLNYAINDLKTRGITDIELNVWENNTTAQKFFKNLKFKTIQKRMRLDLLKER